MLRLADGSLVEMRERSEVSITENRKGVTVKLERGDVAVEAAKQRERHLYVATPDSLVSVTGTIFFVGSGTKGSRVSVVEGEVHVNHAGQDNVAPRRQVTTNARLETVPLTRKSHGAATPRATRNSPRSARLRRTSTPSTAPRVRNPRASSTRAEGHCLYAALLIDQRIADRTASLRRHQPESALKSGGKRREGRGR